MFNHCGVLESVDVFVVCVCLCVHARRRVHTCVCTRMCVCVCVRHGTQLRCKKWWNEPAPLFGNFCLFHLYLWPLWSTLIFYYLLLSDYWPSCYMLYKELTLISSSPPLPELKGQFTCSSNNPQSGLGLFNFVKFSHSCYCGKIILCVEMFLGSWCY